MPPVEFETTISAGERPKTYDLHHAATGTGQQQAYRLINKTVILQAFDQHDQFTSRGANQGILGNNKVKGFLTDATITVLFVRNCSS
jgi:hypothetical protein